MWWVRPLVAMQIGGENIRDYPETVRIELYAVVVN